MSKQENFGEFFAGIAKDIVSGKIHGYSGKTVQDVINKKIDEFNNLSEETASVYTEEERNKVKEATKKVFKKHSEAFSKLSKRIDHPPHYGGDKTYEVIKVLEAWNLDFHLGNVLKYICRAGIKNKETEIEDLEKAMWYLQRKIDKLKEKNGRDN